MDIENRLAQLKRISAVSELIFQAKSLLTYTDSEEENELYVMLDSVLNQSTELEGEYSDSLKKDFNQMRRTIQGMLVGDGCP